jgi:hypothetical protein
LRLTIRMAAGGLILAAAFLSATAPHVVANGIATIYAPAAFDSCFPRDNMTCVGEGGSLSDYECRETGGSAGCATCCDHPEAACPHPWGFITEKWDQC